MRTNIAMLLSRVLLSVAFATGCTGNVGASGDNEEDQAQLKITGSSGAKFSGSCTVGDAGSEQIGGQVPQSFIYNLRGQPLDCKISPDGEVHVELTVGENARSVQRISGGTLKLTYENGSISSVVSSSTGWSGQGSSASSQVISSAGEIDEKPSDTTSEPSNVTSESREVSGFGEVELQGVGNLSIEQADNESLTIEAQTDILPKIKTDVEYNRLIIGSNTSIHTTEPINYKLTVKDLSALEVSGAGDVDAKSISTDKLAIDISGAGDVKISGNADTQKVDISGSGDYKAEDLQSKEVKIHVGGSGSATVNVSDELDARVSGSGSVEYVGNPAVDQVVSGAGRVSKH